MRALARNPAKLETGVPNIHSVIQGDVMDVSSLTRAMQGITTVVSVLGTPLTTSPVRLLSEGTRNMVVAMHAAGVERLLCITGMGAGDSRGHGGFIYDRIILPTLLKNIYLDKDRQEAVVRTCGLQWEIVRPARLTDGPARPYRVLESFEKGTRMSTISRADVARYLVEETLKWRHGGKSVNLTY